MNTILTVKIIAASVFLSLSLNPVLADPPKRQAFGTIKFGDGEKEYTLHMEQMVAPLNRPGSKLKLDGGYIMAHFVISGNKYPPKLSAKYKTLDLTVSTSTVSPMFKFSVDSALSPPADYLTTVKDTWEVLRDIGMAKFGKPVQSSEFPPPDITSKLAFASTDTWNTGGLQVRLGVTSWFGAGGVEGPKFTVNLVAVDPEWEKLSKAVLGPRGVFLPQGATPAPLRNMRWDAVEPERFQRGALEERTGWGVEFPPNSSARYDARTRQLFVTNTERQLELVQIVTRTWNKWNLPSVPPK